MQAEASQQQITSVTGVKFDELFNFAGRNVDSDGVVHLDQRIWVPDSTTVTSHNTRHAFQSDQHLLHFAQLVLNIPQSQHINIGSGGQLSPSVRTHNPATGF